MHRLTATEAAVAAVLHPAEGDLRFVVDGLVVDVDDAGLDPIRERQPAIGIARQDARGQPVCLVLAQNGINPYQGIPFAVVVAAAIAVPVSFLVFRLRAEYFAIGTGVVAEIFFLVLIRFRSLGGGTGTALPGLSSIDPVFRQASTYWSALAVAAAALLATYLLLSSRMGLDLTAIRDNEVAARC